MVLFGGRQQKKQLFVFQLCVILSVQHQKRLLLTSGSCAMGYTSWIASRASYRMESTPAISNF
jgi:hypothetical protein